MDDCYDKDDHCEGEVKHCDLCGRDYCQWHGRFEEREFEGEEVRKLCCGFCADRMTFAAIG